jgi:CBS domain-containing protein
MGNVCRLEMPRYTEPHSRVQAMAVMEKKNIRHLPVFDEDNLLGMMSIKDIIRTFMDQHSLDVTSMSEYMAAGY